MGLLIMGLAAPIALIGLVVAIAVCVFAARASGEDRERWTWVARVLWGCAAAGVLVLTLGLANPEASEVNLVPLATIREQLRELTPTLAAFNLLGNVGVLVPFGLLARPCFGWGIVRSTVGGGMFSLGIEVVQTMTGRAGDVDDVLLNTLGAAIGALLGWLISGRASSAGLTEDEDPAQFDRTASYSSIRTPDSNGSVDTGRH